MSPSCGMKRSRHDSITSIAVAVLAPSTSPYCTATTINPYHTLQVRRDATSSEIRQAYKRLALWHHPARRKGCVTDQQQQQEKQQQQSAAFTNLAACYETLLEQPVRHQYDVLLQKQFRGEVLVGGKPWSSSNHTNATRSTVCSAKQQKQREPVTFVSPHEEMHWNSDNNLPALVTSVSLDDSEDDDDELNDPLVLLRQARGYRPLTDPFDVFDQVFGSKLYPHLAVTQQQGPLLPPTRNKQTSAAWTGSTQTLPNGSLVSTTSRILHNRQLTRTEQIWIRQDGKRQTHVTVVGRDLDDEAPEPLLPHHQWHCLGSGASSWQEILDDWTNMIRTCGVSSCSD